MNGKVIFKENLNREMQDFRQSFNSMQPVDVYNSFYKINFYEEYYMLLMSDFIDEYTQIFSERIVEWLSKFENPLLFLYNEWLSYDGAFSGDWNDMINFITNIYEKEE